MSGIFMFFYNLFLCGQKIHQQVFVVFQKLFLVMQPKTVSSFLKFTNNITAGVLKLMMKSAAC